MHTPTHSQPANAVRASEPALDLARPIPGPAVIETLPTGLKPLPSIQAVAAHVADLLQGRPWVLVAAHAAYPGHDTTPIINVWTEPMPGGGSPKGGSRIEWCCAVVLSEGARLDLLEPRLRDITGAGPTDIGARERQAA